MMKPDWFAIDTLLSAARARIYANIDRRAQLAHGRPVQTANRSVAQLYSKRWIHKRGLQ